MLSWGSFSYPIYEPYKLDNCTKMGHSFHLLNAVLNVNDLRWLEFAKKLHNMWTRTCFFLFLQYKYPSFWKYVWLIFVLFCFYNWHTERRVSRQWILGFDQLHAIKVPVSCVEQVMCRISSVKCIQVRRAVVPVFDCSCKGDFTCRS